jgi:hypothetical protein
MTVELSSWKSPFWTHASTSLSWTSLSEAENKELLTNLRPQAAAQGKEGCWG